MSAVITEDYNIMVNSVELIGTTECLTLQMTCCINPCCCNHVQKYMIKYESNIAYTADRALKIWYQHIIIHLLVWMQVYESQEQSSTIHNKIQV